MKKKILLTLLLALVVVAGQAQKIKMSQPSFSDYLPLLNAQGYRVYSFDTKKMKGAEVEVVVMEYAKGEEPKKAFNFDVNMSLGKKLVIGIVPSSSDSTANYLFRFSEDREFGGRFKLKPIFVPQMPGKKHFVYESRPFEQATSFKKGEMIPLVMYGSYWYDEDGGSFRFCGDNEIKLDFSSYILEFIPHYYVLGIKIK